jgi:hypothetical protein
MTHASLKYAQLLTQGEIFQGDLFMPTKYQRDRPKNDHDCVQHSGRKCVRFVDENQPPTRQMDFGEAQVFQTSDKDGKPTGRPIDPNNVMRYTKREQPFDASKTGKPRASFDAACWQAGVSIHFHWLRHTFGSVMLAHLGKTDGSIFTVSKMMGHSSLQVTADIYGHKIGSQEDHDNIADAFSAFSMGGNNAAAGQSSQAVN